MELEADPSSLAHQNAEAELFVPRGSDHRPQPSAHHEQPQAVRLRPEEETKVLTGRSSK